MLSDELNFYINLPCDIGTIKKDSIYWPIRETCNAKMARQDKLHAQLIEMHPEIQDIIVMNLLTGSFKFEKDSKSIASSIIHLFPEYPEKSYYCPIEVAYPSLKNVMSVHNSPKSNNCNTFNSMRLQLTYTKKILELLLV